MMKQHFNDVTQNMSNRISSLSQDFSDNIDDMILGGNEMFDNFIEDNTMWVSQMTMDLAQDASVAGIIMDELQPEETKTSDYDIFDDIDSFNDEESESNDICMEY